MKDRAFVVIAASGDDLGGADTSVLKVFTSEPTMRDFNSIKRALINSRFNIHGKFTNKVIKELIETGWANSGGLVIEEAKVDQVDKKGLLPTLDFKSVDEIVETDNVRAVEEACSVRVANVYEDYDNREGLMFALEDEYTRDPVISSDKLFVSLVDLLTEMNGKYFLLM